MSSPRDIINEISQLGPSLDRNEPGTRTKLIDLSYKLAASQLVPDEVIQRMWAESSCFALSKIAADLNLFEILRDANGAPLTVQHLASSTRANPVFLSRMLKHLAAMHIILQVDTDQYKSTPLSNAFATPSFHSGLQFGHSSVMRCIQALPEYLRSVDYAYSEDASDGPFQYAHKTTSSLFPWLADNPEQNTHFNSYMTVSRTKPRSWLDEGMFPFRDRILDGYDNESVLLVDVGGGLGQHLEELARKVPETRGKLILQDLPDVIPQVEDPKGKGFKAMVHDFFTSQPIESARSYHFHSVLHDWNDDDCRKILSKIALAMRSGYSKLLVHEMVIADVGATWIPTGMDFVIWVSTAAKERTETDWSRLFNSVGLKLLKVWRFDESIESVLEVELA